MLFLTTNYHVIICVCDCEGSSRHVHKTIGDSLAGWVITKQYSKQSVTFSPSDCILKGLLFASF